MKHTKKILSGILALTIVAGTVNMPTYAENEFEEVSVVDTPAEALPDTAEDAPTSGTCGENLTWTLDSNGTLTIDLPIKS